MSDTVVHILITKNFDEKALFQFVVKKIYFVNPKVTEYVIITAVNKYVSNVTVASLVNFKQAGIDEKYFRFIYLNEKLALRIAYILNEKFK